MDHIHIPLLVILLGLGLRLLYSKRKSQKPYPPGPKGLPIVGNLFDINNERPWITYGKWAKQYGDIVMFWVMGKPVILLGKMEHADALLQRRMMNYGDRPELVMAQELVTQNGWYLGTARSKHNTHKKQRKILAERLRAKALREWAHPAEIPQMHLLLQRLAQTPDRFVSVIKTFTVNVMLNTTFSYGSISSLDHPIVHRINTASDHQFIAQIQGRFWVDYLPFLKYLPSWFPGMGWKRQGLAWRDETDTLYRELWDQTEKKLEKAPDAHPCLVKSLLERDMHQLAVGEGTTLGAAMVDAGTETLTGTTVIFIIIFMYFPRVLEKAREIVDETIGRDRLPTFDDVPKIPFITAMIREAFRWRTVAPIAIPHAVVAEDTYAGFFIPKGATVYALSHHIHQDPEVYPEPETFKPERFLDEKGQLSNLPHAGFGFGSRKCLGTHFAEQTLFLLITSLVWGFDIKAPVDDQGKKILPSLDPMDWGAFLASPPPMDFEAVITPRSAAAVSIINQAVADDL